MRARYGTRTYVCRRITDGTTIERVAEWMTGPFGSSCTTLAFPHISMMTAQSNHSGGVNVTLLDGSVRLWHGSRNAVDVDPSVCPARILRVRGSARTETGSEHSL